MATIKAGTYRFNDALTAIGDYEIHYIPYTVTSNVPGYGKVTCIGTAIDQSGEAGVQIAFTLTNENLALSQDRIFLYRDGWETAIYGKGIKTIKITADSQVSEEFYGWFANNAVPTVGGEWKFNKIIKMPENLPSKYYINFLAWKGYHLVKLYPQTGFWFHDDGDAGCAISLLDDYTTSRRTLFYHYIADENKHLFYNDYTGKIVFDEVQTVAMDFYKWLTDNAVKTAEETPEETPEETAGVSVRYNAADLVSLEAGQGATLACAGKKMRGDVVVTFTGGGWMRYDGVKTAIAADKVATFACAGKRMRSDLEIAAL